MEAMATTVDRALSAHTLPTAVMVEWAAVEIPLELVEPEGLVIIMALMGAQEARVVAEAQEEQASQ
jgi:hypothetical protein